MTYQVRYIDGKHQVYRTEDGIHTVNVGPRWLTPREAIDYAKKLDAMADTTPLRDPEQDRSDGVPPRRSGPAQGSREAIPPDLPPAS